MGFNKKSLKNLKPIKPGEVKNPKGRPILSPEIKELRSLTIDVYREVIQIVMTGTLAELKVMAEDPKTAAFKVGIAVCVMKAIKEGDYATIERISERIIGKIPEVVTVTGNFTREVTEIDPVMLRAAMDRLQRDV
jgi:hypothetical protein